MTRIALWLAQHQLKSRKPARRLRALQKLRASLNNAVVALDDKLTIALLDHTLTDTEAEIRREAAATLGDLRDSRSLSPLVRALNDRSEEVQETAIQSLKRLDDRDAVEALVPKLVHGSATIQWRAAQALRSLGWRPKTTSEQIRFFVASGEIERLVAFGAEAVKPLVGILGDAANEKRITAINILGEIGDPAGFKPLQNALRDADVLVRTAAAYALTRAGCLAAVPALVIALKDNERNVRLAAALALGALGDAQTVEPLIKLLNDKDWEIRGAALESLGRLGDTRALQSVAKHLEDTDQEVREVAANALGRVGNESIVEKLVITMVDAHSGVRQAAARALAKIDPNWESSERVQRMLPDIQAAMKNRDASVQSAATSLLRRVTVSTTGESGLALSPARDDAERRQQTVTRIFQELLRDADADLRCAAAEAIGRLKLTACADGLKAALDDGDKRVKIVAQNAMAKLALGEGAAGGGRVTFLAKTSAAPASGAETLLVEDVLICSALGEVLHEWKCRNLAGWLRVLEFVSQKAEQLGQVLTMGEFRRLEIQMEEARIVVIATADRGVMVRVKNSSAVAGAPASQSPPAAGISEEMKEAVTEWLRHAPSVRGVMVRGLRFADQTIVCDVDSRDITVAALEQAYRSLADAFQLLLANQIMPLRLAWSYESTGLYCARRADKTILGAFASAKTGETDFSGLNGQLAEFQNMNPV